ncbi:MAG: FecR domain-containing protein [Bacteroidota bacterium]
MSNKVTNNEGDLFRQESFRNWAEGLSEADSRYWDNWLANNPHRAREAFDAASETVGFRPDNREVVSSDIERQWERLNARIVAHEGIPEGASIRTMFWLRAAAAMLTIACLGAASWLWLSTPVELTYKTGFGEKQSVELSDGTTISLNGNSTLKTRNSWRLGVPREVWLQGEAYFSVKSHPESENLRSFVVHTGDVDVRVLGTKFNVKSRRENTNVLLDEGKVELTANVPGAPDKIRMSPGDFVSFSRPNVHVEKTKPKNTGRYTTWRQGYLEFDSTSITEVISTLKDQYGIQIHLKDKSILNETLTGKVSSDKIDELFSSMEKMFGVRCTRQGKDVYLSRN